ncbi:DUF423 domain-containing protein [Paenibacillus chitinolyticus]|uniref:DUF423 domain-containing protein n=1 Tax=Paenibacillus chitinolyticus TaxID=79263 RepID=A0A410WTC5_9BACL|nr:DUF423 domain-containing protein [Paenibacillus chitinolyticus]MCY9588655.1 DUF423 domain-containing protein [Paenibacillus chitinolyticus]MCY9595841.1 DUF423 domain-containing protein [Paenibacillus chitinolyticus]QAV17592.1 DUF423 domain-containing protein [Paenibacillus chitinolyticus]GKS09470.1 UPF0382 membrane protein YwdK [Paenibacillus chitinolyticus]
MMRLFMMLGSVNMFLAVALGAFGAHMLKTKISADMLAVYQTGVQYHMIHAVGLIAIGLAADRLTQNQSLVNASGWAIVIGIILFSGSLYVLSLSGIKVLGAITPFGGVAFLAGWVMLAIAAMK